MPRFTMRCGRLRVLTPLLLSWAVSCAYGTGATDVAPSVVEPSGATGDAGAAAIETELALLTFDSAWSRVRNSYYDSTFRGLDWNAVRTEFRPRAESAQTVRELRAVLNEMLARLGESHFGIIPREAVDDLGDDDSAGGRTDSDPGLELRWVDGQLTVVRVRPDGAAAAAGVRPGWQLTAIGEQSVSAWSEAITGAETEAARKGLLTGTLSAATSRLGGTAGSTVEVTFRDHADRDTVVMLERRRVRGEPVRFGNLPTFFSYLDHERRVLPDGGCAGVIHFNVWMLTLSAEFNRAVDAYSDCRGLIIDLRGNPGGVGGMVMGTAGSFFDETTPLGVMKTRQGEVRFVAMPRRITSDGTPRTPFTGAIAVLVDEQSMSTSEIFAAGMQTTGRARVFGTQTPGYALPALMLRLPNDDVLYHAIANLTDPEGRRIEGAGVIPDEPLPLTRADLLAGRDRALDAALEWIGAQPRTSSRAVPDAAVHGTGIRRTR